MKKGFSAIDILLGLLVLAAVIMVSLNVMKYSAVKDAEIKTIQEQIDEQIVDIQKARQKADEFQKELDKDLNE